MAGGLRGRDEEAREGPRRVPGGRREAAPCRRGAAHWRRAAAVRACPSCALHRQARRSTHATFQAVTRASSAALFCSALSACWEPEADGRDAISLSRRGPTPHPQNEPSACDFAGRACSSWRQACSPRSRRERSGPELGAGPRLFLAPSAGGSALLPRYDLGGAVGVLAGRRWACSEVRTSCEKLASMVHWLFGAGLTAGI